MTNRRTLWAVFALLLATGCDAGATGDHRDAVPDAAVDVADDVVPDVAGGGAWTDPASGLTWETRPSTTGLDWSGALAHCDALVLDGHEDWRLPTIDELRLLMRGCPDTVAGGPCPETDACPSESTECYNDDCMGCEWMKGPGLEGCYWPPEMLGACDWYWSATPSADPQGFACFAHFGEAHLSHDDQSHAGPHYAVCVR